MYASYVAWFATIMAKTIVLTARVEILANYLITSIFNFPLCKESLQS